MNFTKEKIIEYVSVVIITVLLILCVNYLFSDQHKYNVAKDKIDNAIEDISEGLDELSGASMLMEDLPQQKQEKLKKYFIKEFNKLEKKYEEIDSFYN